MIIACQQHKAGAGTIVHSDCGAQHTSQAWQDALVKNRIVGLMGAKGNCHENVAIERFFGTLEDERIKDESSRGAKEAQQTL